mmetsp:Transcript_15737/g.44109  ORF Transcript_15737/g.44109 Transcript_15737/m.44109 type:complete len:327 (-) Transcript_15737:24-1004(-)
MDCIPICFFAPIDIQDSFVIDTTTDSNDDDSSSRNGNNNHGGGGVAMKNDAIDVDGGTFPNGLPLPLPPQPIRKRQLEPHEHSTNVIAEIAEKKEARELSAAHRGIYSGTTARGSSNRNDPPSVGSNIRTKIVTPKNVGALDPPTSLSSPPKVVDHHETTFSREKADDKEELEERYDPAPTFPALASSASSSFWKKIENYAETRPDHFPPSMMMAASDCSDASEDDDAGDDDDVEEEAAAYMSPSFHNMMAGAASKSARFFSSATNNNANVTATTLKDDDRSTADYELPLDYYSRLASPSKNLRDLKMSKSWEFNVNFGGSSSGGK